MTVAIIGAGMAGLLAGCMFRSDAQVYEAAPSLPNNHHSLLRFRTDTIGAHLNIPFQDVEVLKIVKPWRNAVADAMAYSEKCTGIRSLRSSVTATGKVERRFIAPPDLIASMADRLHRPIDFGQSADKGLFRALKDRGDPVISTIPMPLLMELLSYEDSELQFNHSNGLVIQVHLPIDTDVCATIYYPDPGFDVSRATMTGSLLQIECPVRWAGPNLDAVVDSWQGNADVTWNSVVLPVLTDFNLESVARQQFTIKRQGYAKILPVDDRARKRFIMWATDQWGIYSLGRYACWRPGLLLDDVFHDTMTIQRMLAGSNYAGKVKQ